MMGISAVDRNHGLLGIVFQGLLFDPQAFGNIVRSSRKRDGPKRRRNDCKEQGHRFYTIPYHLRSPNDRVRLVAWTKFTFEI